MDLRLRELFEPRPGYLNTASVGIPPVTAADAVAEALDGWRHGRLQPPDFDDSVNRSRRAWAAISGVDPTCVATGSTVSAFVGLVAASLPDGAQVVTAAGEFTSVTFPFMAHASRGVVVTEVPLEELSEVSGHIDLIAVSTVQSATGRVADLDALIAACRRTGARLLVDTTQSCGWLPLKCADVDYVVCAGYKWLTAPRGTAFMAVRPDRLSDLRPLAAGWYAGDDPWTSLYGGPLRLATDARRFDVSPAWLCWVGAALSLELFASIDLAGVRDHNVGLADDFLARLGLPSQDSAIVTVEAPNAAELLGAADVMTAVRAGRVRLSFHLYNDETDVARAAKALSAA